MNKAAGVFCAICLIALLLPLTSSAATIDVAFYSGGMLYRVPRDIPDGMPLAETAISALIAGPTASETMQGMTSAIPNGTELVNYTTDASSVRIDLSEAVLVGLDEVNLGLIYDQVKATLAAFNLDADIKLTCRNQPLSSYLPPVAPIGPIALPQNLQAAEAPSAGSLSGKKITLSPGHGLFWNGGGWAYQRPVYCSPLSNEDLHTLEICQYLQTYLVTDGAILNVVRCTDKNYGNHSSGNPWWKMATPYWAQKMGYPCSVYASYTGDCTLGTGGSEANDDIRARPLMSDADKADIYVSVHTNGLAGDCTSNCPTGSETFYDGSSEHQQWAGISQTLATDIQNSVMNAITANVDSTWTCHGACVKDSNGNYGEIRIPDRAASLTELAYHDTCNRDADANHLRDNFFRSAAMWGMYKGICTYFGVSPTWDFYSDEIVSDTIPTSMDPGRSYSVSITMRNRGVLWNSARGFKLGAVGDSDPFTSSTRVVVSSEVAPGSTYTFNFTMTAPSAPGTYTTDWRMVRDGVTWFGQTLSKQISICTPIVITSQPANKTASVGKSVSFLTMATGCAPLTRQWRKNGVNIPGATVSTYTISSVSTHDAGSYDCVITNPVSSVTSSPAVLTVSSQPVGAVSAAKALAPGTALTLSGPIVTRSFDQFFYMEDATRSAGIRVELASGTAPRQGDTPSVLGILQTANGELVIADAVASPNGSYTIPAAIGLTNKAANSTMVQGMLVRTWGKASVAPGATDSFTISDGSFSKMIVKLYGIPLPADGKYVTVSGVLGFEGNVPVLRVNNADDIVTYP